MNIETKIIKKGYNPHLSEGSLITPIFNSSTYCFKTAEDGARAFAVAYGKKRKKKMNLYHLFIVESITPICRF